jgi:hypothetical protein
MDVIQEALHSDKEKVLEFADKLMACKNDLIPVLTYHSPAYPLLLDCEFAIERALEELKKNVEGM